MTQVLGNREKGRERREIGRGGEEEEGEEEEGKEEEEEEEGEEKEKGEKGKIKGRGVGSNHATCTIWITENRERR